MKTNFIKQSKRKLIQISTLILLISISISTTACSAFVPKVNAEDLMSEVMDKDGKSLDTRLYNMTDSKTVYYNNHSSIKIE
jgi:Cu/Ag efflux pump CusA